MQNPYQPTLIGSVDRERPIRLNNDGERSRMSAARWSGIFALTAWMSFGAAIVFMSVSESFGLLILLGFVLLGTSFFGLLCSIYALAKRQWKAIPAFFANGIWWAAITALFIWPPDLNFCC